MEIIDDYFDGFECGQWFKLCMVDDVLNEQLEKVQVYISDCCQFLDDKFEDKKCKLQQGDDLVLGVLKIVKVYLVIKCCIQLGDKMVGCYGNKGVVLVIMLVEDMLYDVNGILVDIVFNLLGVLLCMNVGQIFEIYLGFVVKGLGEKINCMFEEQCKVVELCKFLYEIYNEIGGCEENFDELGDNEIFVLVKNLCGGVLMVILVFDGVKECEIKVMLKLVDLLESGQMCLFDGCIGNQFECLIIVGYMYMFKLNYLVDDKMYVCFIGLYSLVIQQLLGGKVQFGGQCFGEMEVWVLEVYGVVYILQEMLMVKLDDVNGWIKMYKNIVDGDYCMEVGMFEFFNVLIKEICLFGIDIELEIE